MKTGFLVTLSALLLTVGCLGPGGDDSPIDEAAADAIISEVSLVTLASGSIAGVATFGDKCGKPGNAPSRKCSGKIYLRGDVNKDNQLTKEDGPLFTQAVKNASGFYCPAVLDVNLDGRVTQDDVGVFHSGLNEYLKGGELPWKEHLLIKERDCFKVSL